MTTAADSSIGPLRLHQALGRGAVGTVYRATDTRDGGTVAVKVVRRDMLPEAEGEELLTRFRREAELSARLHHRNIVRVFDYGETAEQAWLTMELVDGRDLKAVAAVRPPLRDLLDLFLQLLDGLGFAHDKGIVHRDVKPANALVGADGTLKLGDFGLARFGASDLTALGTVMGTPLYMAPEQLMGEAVDTRADLYAAGVTLFNLLTGAWPFNGALGEIMRGVLDRPPPLPSAVCPEVPAAFDAVVMRALAKAPSGRFASAGDFAEAVRWVLPTLTPTPRRATPATLTPLEDTLVPTRQRVAALIERCRDGHAGLPELRTLLGSTQAGGGIDAIMLEAANRAHAMAVEAAAGWGREERARRDEWTDAVLLLVSLHDSAAPDLAARMAPLLQDLRRRIAAAALMQLDAVQAEIASPDPVALRDLCRTLERFDLLGQALQHLHDEAMTGAMRAGIRAIAGEVLGKITATIHAFTDTADELARFDMASALVEMDELIRLAGHALEGGLAGDAVADFIAASRRLVPLTGQELLPAVGTDAPFAAKLRLLGRLYQFSMDIDDPSSREALHTLGKEVRAVLAHLTAAILAGLDRDPKEPRRSHLDAQLLAVHEVALSLGWRQFANNLLRRLRDSVVR